MKIDKIVIFGANGMLGTNLVKTFKYYDIYAFSKSQVNITNRNVVFNKISKIKPSLVINSAAYTNVDGSEKNRKKAFNVNGEAVKIVAEACKKNKAIMIHFSTDSVFDGRKKGGYKENDEVNPINAYGKSKALGEKYLIETLDNYYLIRTSWLFGGHEENFVNNILKLAKENKELKVVNDQFGRPTYIKDLAENIKEIVTTKKLFGIYHITNSGTTTWFKFAKKIIKLAHLNNQVKQMKLKELDGLAKRPKYSVLLNTKLPTLRHWSSALKEYLGI